MQVSKILQQSQEAPSNLHPIEDAPNIMESRMRDWYVEKMLFYATHFKVWDTLPAIAEEIKRALQSNMRAMQDRIEQGTVLAPFGNMYFEREFVQDNIVAFPSVDTWFRRRIGTDSALLSTASVRHNVALANNFGLHVNHNLLQQNVTHAIERAMYLHLNIYLLFIDIWMKQLGIRRLKRLSLVSMAWYQTVRMELSDGITKLRPLVKRLSGTLAQLCSRRGHVVDDEGRGRHYIHMDISNFQQNLDQVVAVALGCELGDEALDVN